MQNMLLWTWNGLQLLFQEQWKVSEQSSSGEWQDDLHPMTLTIAAVWTEFGGLQEQNWEDRLGAMVQERNYVGCTWSMAVEMERCTLTRKILEAKSKILVMDQMQKIREREKIKSDSQVSRLDYRVIPFTEMVRL